LLSYWSGHAGGNGIRTKGHTTGIAIMGIHFLSKENHLRLACGRQKPVLGAIISQGAPLAIASICLTVLMFSSNKIILSSLGRTGIYAFALCMNLLLIYNLFLGGVCRTIQSLGSIQVGKGDNEATDIIASTKLIITFFILIDVKCYSSLKVTSRYANFDPETSFKKIGNALNDVNESMAIMTFMLKKSME
jgi:hypothetical protein